MDQCNKPVFDGEMITFTDKVSFRAIHSPCHTIGHMMYFTEFKDKDGKKDSFIFTGDCLFQGGVGMFFEGTPRQMLAIIKDMVLKLPPTTQMFFGHEYAYSNYKFAKSILPEN